jgi:hypothetical protein
MPFASLKSAAAKTFAGSDTEPAPPKPLVASGAAAAACPGRPLPAAPFRRHRRVAQSLPYWSYFFLFSGIAQHFIGLVDLLKLFVGFLVVRVQVRVMFAG